MQQIGSNWVIMGKRHRHIFSTASYRILFILACNDAIQENLDKFEFQSDLTTNYGVSCALERQKKIPVDF